MSLYYHDGQAFSAGNLNTGGNNWQNNSQKQISNPANSNITYATQSHVSSQSFSQEITNDESEDEFDSVCDDCGMTGEQNCRCDPRFK